MTNVSRATKSMKPTEPAPTNMPPTAAPTTMPAASTPATTPAASSTTATTATTATLSGECSDVRHHAERANRNARGQNAYRSLLHGTFPTRSSKALRCSQRSRAHLTDLTLVAAASFEMAKSKFH
jgi:hypothetical protein